MVKGKPVALKLSSRRKEQQFLFPSALKDGEVTQKRSKEPADCVKIEPPIKNMKKNLMCQIGFLWAYIFVYQGIAEQITDKSYKRSKCRCKGCEEVSAKDVRKSKLAGRTG